MSRVKSRGNASTEQRLIRLLREYKITGWRRGVKLPGSPDFVWREARLAVFLDGCFWHGCPVHGSIPVTRKEYWSQKLARNVLRDREVSEKLRARGWAVLRLWECDLTKARHAQAVFRLRVALKSESH